MTDTDDQITLDQVQAAARRVVTLHPGRVNPTNDAVSCRYTDADDPDWHCLGGQVLIELGLRLPPEGKLVHMMPDAYRLTDDAISFLVSLQGHADSGYRNDVTPGTERLLPVTPWAVAYVNTCNRGGHDL